jgi:histidinol-phosphate aminotransferase
MGIMTAVDISFKSGLRSRPRVSGEIESLVPYPPGKPIEELERELGISGSIKLASNENPIGPSRKAVEAVMGALERLNRYPDGSCYYLKEKLSARLAVPPGAIVMGNGSNEIIEFIVRTFMTPGTEAVMADPSFAIYPIAVKAQGGAARLVPLKGLRHDLLAMAKAVNAKTRVVFIANPNNPTGTIVTNAELGRFINDLPGGVITCVDEAYCEYVRSDAYPATLEYVKDGWPVVLLRTFSKAYGLAGLRVGYGVAHPELTSLMERVRQPFNVNSLAQAAAIAALDDTAHIESSLRKNAEGLEYLYREVDALGLEYVPTEANFFLIKVGDGEGVYGALLKQGIIVRPMDSYGLGEFIRVTVGLQEENERFIAGLKDALD